MWQLFCPAPSLSKMKNIFVRPSGTFLVIRARTGVFPFPMVLAITTQSNESGPSMNTRRSPNSSPRDRTGTEVSLHYRMQHRALVIGMGRHPLFHRLLNGIPVKLFIFLKLLATVAVIPGRSGCHRLLVLHIDVGDIPAFFDRAFIRRCPFRARFFFLRHRGLRTSFACARQDLRDR